MQGLNSSPTTENVESKSQASSGLNVCLKQSHLSLTALLLPSLSPSFHQALLSELVVKFVEQQDPGFWLS